MLERRNGGYGFSVIGSAPVIVQSVEKEGAAKVIYTDVNLLSSDL